MAARKTVSPKTPKTPAAQAVEQVVPPVEEKSAFVRYMERIAEARDALFDELGAPSVQRRIFATLSYFVAALGVCYVGVQFAAYLSLAVMLGTGSAFLTFAATFMVGFLMTIAAIKAADKAYSFVVDFDVEAAKSAVISAKNTVVGWFERKPAVAA